jgi:hypothetical protein
MKLAHPQVLTISLARMPFGDRLTATSLSLVEFPSRGIEE